MYFNQIDKKRRTAIYVRISTAMQKTDTPPGQRRGLGAYKYKVVPAVWQRPRLDFISLIAGNVT